MFARACGVCDPHLWIRDLLGILSKQFDEFWVFECLGEFVTLLRTTAQGRLEIRSEEGKFVHGAGRVERGKFTSFDKFNALSFSSMFSLSIFNRYKLRKW